MQTQFKGLDQPVTLYEISGIRGAYQLTLPEKTVETLVSLAAPLPMACFLIEGKMVSKTATPGALLRLAGTHSAEATIEGQVTAYTNVRLTLEPPGQAPLTDVYAKVVASEPLDTKVARVRLEFTALPEDAKAFLTQAGQTPSAT
jgi:adenylate cyclase